MFVLTSGQGPTHFVGCPCCSVSGSRRGPGAVKVVGKVTWTKS